MKGPSSVDVLKNKKCKVIDVISAKDMLNAVKKNMKIADIFIGAAAVSDYKPVKIAKNKIKKKDIGSDTINLKLVKNPDIIKYVGEHKDKKVVVGFALETKNLLSYAKTKLKEKQLDMIVANGANTISSAASKFVFKAVSSILRSRVARPEFTSIATKASAWSITKYPPDFN